MVPLSDDTQSLVDSLLNAIEYISALSMPRRNSCSNVPVDVLNTRIKVPLSLVVAHRDPSWFSEIQLSFPE
jgi:hypothetical protein